MSRAIRRHEGARIAEARNSLYRRIMGHDPRNPGQGSVRSPFDCGISGCTICGHSDRPEEPWGDGWVDAADTMYPHAKRRKKKRTVEIQSRRWPRAGGQPTKWEGHWRRYVTVQHAKMAVVQLNKGWGRWGYEFRLKPSGEAT